MASSNLRAAVLALAALALVGAAAAIAALRPAEESGAAAVSVIVTGPEGGVWSGSVSLENGTALSALLAAANAGGFTVETRTYPYGAYVVAIAGHRAVGVSGWIYEIEREGALRSGDRASDRALVADGDVVRWSWTRG